MYRWKFVVLFLFLSPLVWGQDPSLPPMTTDDILDMVVVGDGLVHPSGEWVLYSKSDLDWKKNKRKKTYHRVAADGSDRYQFLGEGEAGAPKFSPDGKFLAFLRGVEKKKQIFVMRMAGGEAVQLSKHKEGIRSFKWFPESSALIFVSVRARDKKEEKRHKAGYDSILVDEGPNGQSAGRWNHLWKITIDDKQETKLTDDDLLISSYDPGPDGKRVVFTARRENRRNQSNLSEIYLLDLGEDKKISRLTENAAGESGVKWAPDGKTFSYSAPDDKTWELKSNKLWIMDPDSGQARMVSGAFRNDVRQVFWSPDSKRILFSGLDGTDSNVYELMLSNGQLSKVTDVRGTVALRSVSRDFQTMVLSQSDFDSPADLYLSSTEVYKPVRLTDANPGMKELALAEGRVIRWQSQDGLEVEGLLFLPHDYKEGTQVPLILNIHGGPAGVFTNSFSGRYHVFGGLGYASLCPNVRGSRGYGDDFLRGNMYDIGGGDFNDLMTGVDKLVADGLVDPDKMGLRGWSYGGILGGWTVTHTDRFKAASLGAMVSDWTSEFGPGFNYDVRLWYIGKTPWENPEGYREKSALTHAANVTTPTLIIHGMRDITDTESQSMLFYTALKEMGKTVRYLRVPREPHGFREPRHQRTRDMEELKWMQKYVLGLDWEPWERPETEEKDEEDSTAEEEKP